MLRKIAAGSMFVAALYAIAPAGTASAQGLQRNEDRGRGDDRASRIIDELRSVIQDAERRRNPDQETIGDLRRIMRRYDSPYTATLLQDDFRDGDMRRNPAWDIVSGDFIVDRQFGMRSQQRSRRAPPNQPQGGDLGNRLLGAVIDEVARPRQGQSNNDRDRNSDRAEAYVRQSITSAFSITLSVNSRSRDGGRIEFVVYDGGDRRDGYRLAYNADGGPNFELLRAGGRGPNVLQSSNSRIDLEDGGNHEIVWTRQRDGDMEVQVDGRTVLQASDRGNNGNFDGFGVINYGGDYGIRSVVIAGTDRR